MKKIILFLFLAGTLCAQYSVNWISYEYIDLSSDVTRSIAYNPTTDHVLVASRFGGTFLDALDASTGQFLFELNTEGISGGTYDINMVEVADDGTIYVSNLNAPPFNSSVFKVYRYENEQATPTLVFEDALSDGRYGDALAVHTYDGINYVYASGLDNPNIVILKDTGSQLEIEKSVALPVPGNARHGISPLANGNIWINAANPQTPASLITEGGTLIAAVPDSLASPGGTSAIEALKLGQFKLLTVANAYSATIRTVRYFEDLLGTVTFDYFGEDSDSSALFYPTGYISNINATADLDYDTRRNAMITLSGWNSIASVSLEPLLKTSTPRDSTLTVSIDGLNDFFPTDHVGYSNGRDMYLTWDNGKVFFGFSGEMLLDPLFKRYLYIAFDLDPLGTNGTTTPPESRGGLSELPFLADVVYMVEPFDNADYLIGYIYKWNGSSWVQSEYDGNIAAQGALAYADAGEDKLTEFSAIRNANGIGDNFTDISIMAYLAEDEGNILASFPDKNKTGDVNSFSHYFYADQLGSGYFPTDTNFVQVIKSTITALEDQHNIKPEEFQLLGNFPNPFNPQTTIKYNLPKSADIELTIFDISGRILKTYSLKNQKPGLQQFQFDGSDLSSGIYFYRLNADNRVIDTQKMVLIK